jgi:hypothetical protein
MAKKEKSYLDYILDNQLNVKKRGVYFGSVQEEAIVTFNSPETSALEKTKLYYDVIEPAFRRAIDGVLEMPKFHFLGKINRVDLVEATYSRMIEKIHKFKPGMISAKSGLPVKAYSYFSTVAKNYILEYKTRFEKIQEHKADVETSIDLSILSEDTLQKLSNQDKNDVNFDGYEQVFNETKKKILKKIEEIIIAEEEKEDKKDEDVLKIGYILKYLINKWEKIEFMKKNEFMRILTLYTGLKQQKVSLLFKRFKVAILSELNVNGAEKIRFGGKDEDDEDDDLSEDPDTIKDIDDTEIDDSLPIEEQEIDPEIEKERKRKERIKKINTTEDFESYMEYEKNEKFKEEWQAARKAKSTQQK